jgi:outer membrane lipoprotein
MLNSDQRDISRESLLHSIYWLFLLSACAHAISEQYRQAATQGVGFSQIFKDPDTYINGIFIFGGTIVDTTNTKEGSEIEVIQNPLNRYGEIADRDVSAGRLILITSRRLDPLIYKGGRTLTFAGNSSAQGKNRLGG